MKRYQRPAIHLSIQKIRAYVFLAAAFLCVTACSDQKTSPTLSESERLALPANSENGARLFRACAVCHERTQGAAHRLGPTLWNIYNQPAGKQSGFVYSRALTNASFTWDDAALDQYLKEPTGFVPGGRMSFVGEPSRANRRDLIAYLRTLQ